MIEKITPDHILGLDGLPTTIMPDSAKLMRKINELVDVVNELHEEAKSNATIRANHEHKIEEFQAKDEEIAEWIAIVGDLRKQVRELQSRVSILEEHAHPTATTEPTYKNWIGKLCKFWNGENNKTVGVLMEVREIQNKVFFVDDIFCKYEYCEPVKPDDDIIYKGEQK